MNKTVFKITIFSLAVCFLTGCEDFLNKDVLGYSTDENFYDTQYCSCRLLRRILKCR